jgi:hypothetical protein
MVIRYFCGHFGIFSRIGLLYQEKSGNPAIISYNASIVKINNAMSSLGSVFGKKDFILP